VGDTAHLVDGPELPKRLVVRDTDDILRKLLWAAVIATVVGAIAWSTVAIGGLLSRMAPQWVAYLVAGAFDLSWITFMGAEYYLRFEPRRAWLPRICGWASLGVSVAAIAGEGHLVAHSWAIGAAGGGLSLLAKGLWTVVMWTTVRKLSSADQQWYVKEMSQLEADRARLPLLYRVQRERQAVSFEMERLGLAAQQLRALGQAAAPELDVPQARSAEREPAPESGIGVPSVPEVPQTAPEPVRTVPEREAEVPEPGPAVLRTVPELAQARSAKSEIRRLLDGGLEDPKEIRAEVVRTVPDANPESVARMIRMEIKERKLRSA
jgi:hypothetical protein